MCFWIFKKKKNKEEKKVEEIETEETKVEEKAPVATPGKGNDKNKKSETNTTRKETTKKESAATKVEEKSTKTPTKKVYHVSLRKDDGKWQVKYGGGKKAIKLFDTQAEAIKFAEERADSQEGSISIHKKDGKIRKQDYSKKAEEKKTEDK